MFLGFFDSLDLGVFAIGMIPYFLENEYRLTSSLVRDVPLLSHSLNGKYYQFLTLFWSMVHTGSPATLVPGTGVAVAVKVSAKVSPFVSLLVIR